MVKTLNSKTRSVSVLLLQNRDDNDGFWSWLRREKTPTLREANKFLLGAILDYQIPAEVAWGNARRLSEDILGNPDHLWHKITSVSLSEWMSKRKEYALHRFPKAHERIWTIGKRIVQQYNGDARQIWQGQSIDATLYRLNALGIGEQISRMVAGALYDTGQVQGRGEVKVDIHVRRVLGRVFQGNAFAMQEAGKVTELTYAMHPENPWLLDRPLYSLGKQACRSQEPDCPACYLRQECVYYDQVSR
jgi:endonuclease III